MPVRRYTEGDELRRHTRIEISFPAKPEDVATFSKAIEGSLTQGPFGFERSVQPAESWAMGVLSGAGLPTDGNYSAKGKYPEKIWFAAEILNKLLLVRAFIDRGDAEKAAWFSYELGLVAEEWRARQEFPARARKHGAQIAAGTRHKGVQKEKARFCAEYRELRALLPDASRPVLINKVYDGDPIPTAAPFWAKEADNKDGFVRKGGRPKRAK